MGQDCSTSRSFPDTARLANPFLAQRSPLCRYASIVPAQRSSIVHRSFSSLCRYASIVPAQRSSIVHRSLHHPSISSPLSLPACQPSSLLACQPSSLPSSSPASLSEIVHFEPMSPSFIRNITQDVRQAALAISESLGYHARS